VEVKEMILSSTV